MASGVHAIGSSREPEEWIRATERARAARAVVAGQIADLLVAADITGGRDLLVARIRELGHAERGEGQRMPDPMVARAAAMNLSVACGAYVVRLDLKQDRPVHA